MSRVIKADERVIFFPTLARELDDDGWDVRIHGWIFEPEQGSLSRRAVLALLDSALRLSGQDMESDILRRRVMPFLADNERGKRLSVRTGERTHELPASGADGHFATTVRLSTDEVRQAADGGFLPFEAVTRPGDTRRFGGRARLLPRRGVSVISDIDDTVKVSEVSDVAKLLRNTFLEEFVAVPGMADVYQRWAARGAEFHFVSSSPWQLYEELDAFLGSQGFPSATFHLRTLRLKTPSVLQALSNQFETKLAALEPLLQSYPARQFVLVGDAGEKDPEVYGALARKYPAQIVHVFIRNVHSEADDSERMRSAFADLPRELWELFRDPETLRLADE